MSPFCHNKLCGLHGVSVPDRMMLMVTECPEHGPREYRRYVVQVLFPKLGKVYFCEMCANAINMVAQGVLNA